MTKISAIIPTLNEEVHIEDAIQSVSFADEIIVIDSFSTDKTVELAKKYDVKIIKREFDDFSSQKNYAIDAASHPWIYMLDADERVTPKLKEEILAAVKDPKGHVGFYTRRVWFFLNRKMKYTGFQRDKVIRLFLKEYCIYNGNLVHERIKFNGNIGFFKGRINHYSFRGYNHQIGKINKAAGFQAKQLFAKNQNITPYHLIIKPLYRFLLHYIFRLGFLDGFPGFVMSNIIAYGVFTRYVKLWMLKNNME